MNVTFIFRTSVHRVVFDNATATLYTNKVIGAGSRLGEVIYEYL